MTYQAGTEPHSAHRQREGGKTRPALVSAFVANIWASHKLFLRSTLAFLALQGGYTLFKNSSRRPEFHHCSVSIREKFWVRGTP